MREITIAGGGLAGLALGIALRLRGVPVTLHEAGAYPRHRVCGEFLCGVTEESLGSLGIADLVEGGTRLTRAAWFRNEVRVLCHDLPMPARGISRHRLDRSLAGRFRNLGGTLLENSRLPTGDWSRPGTVVATGRVPDADSHLIGLKLHLRDFALEADLEMHCAPGGYIGLCTVDDGRVNASALFRIRPDLKAPREQLQRAYLEACGFRALIRRMDRAGLDPDSCAAVSGVSAGRFRCNPEPGLCTIGDRFGMIGPFTGNGMSMALESAAMAVDPVADHAAGRIGWDEASQQVRDRLRRRFRKRLFLSALLHRTLLDARTLPFLAGIGRVRILPVGFLFHQLR